jgi:CMP-N-acetylneuraminic acid synthetase
MPADSPTPSVVAFIPAREGSKRVPGKNIRRLGEHPMLAYTIAAALGSKVFDAVVISTDSTLYAEIARHYGAEVLGLRPAEFATSTSPDVEWISYTIGQLETLGRHYDCFSILRPTSPFRQAATIRRAWDAFNGEAGVDSLRAVEKCGQHPGKMWVVRGQRMLPLMPLTPAERPWHSCQYADLPEVYVQNASLEIARTALLKSASNIAGTTVMPFLTDDLEGFDINDPYDWWRAEAMLQSGEAKLPVVDYPPFPQ